MKFRKKPVVVEAVQLLWSTWSNEMFDHAGVGKLSEGKPEGCWLTSDGKAAPLNDIRGDSRIGLWIPTLEGLMLAAEGDWIIRGVRGELYACKPDIFEVSYEEVKE